MKPQVRIGDEAPDVSAVTSTGEFFRLADYEGKQTVVLYFYPRDNTTKCSAQACAFRDAFEEFVKQGAVVVGVSSDSVQRHANFAQRLRLPFILLSDEDGALRTAFGVPKTWGLLPGRVTYVIDREGIVRHIFDSQWRETEHIGEALRALSSMS